MRRFKIDILEQHPIKIPGQQSRNVWEEAEGLTGLWAGVSDLSGRDFYANQADNIKRVVTFDVGWTDHITENHRVRFEGQDYRITRIYQGQYGRISMKIDAERIEGGADA